VKANGQAAFGLSGKTTRVMLDRGFSSSLDGTRRNGLPIALTELPEWAGPMTHGQSEVALYVEGGRYEYEAGSWVLELMTSSATGSAIGNLPWQNLEPGWSWAEFDPEVAWLDLYGVTYPVI